MDQATSDGFTLRTVAGDVFVGALSAVILTPTGVPANLGQHIMLSDGTNSCETPVVSAEPHIKITYNATDGMTLDVDGVTTTCPYDGTLGSGDLSTKATQRDLIRMES